MKYPKDLRDIIIGIMGLIIIISILVFTNMRAHAFPAELGGNDVPLWQQEEAQKLPASPHIQIPATRSAYVGELIFKTALKYNLNPYMMIAFASIESDFFPESNLHKLTQYKGVFQIGKQEWELWGCGKQCYIFDAEDNIEAACAMLARHAEWFKFWYGRAPTAGELYMIHQQGRGFFTHHTLTNVRGNPYPGMHGSQTWESFGKGWTEEVDRRIALFTRLSEIVIGNIP